MRRIRKMTAKQKKLFLVTSVMSVFVMAVTILVTGGKLNFSPIGARGATELVEGSITWTTSNSEKYGSGQKPTFLRHTQRGTGIYLYSYNSATPSSSLIMSTRKDNTGLNKDYGLFVSSEVGSDSNLFSFQSITSISVETASSSQSGAGFTVHTSVGGSAVATQSVSGGTTYTFTSEVYGAHYLIIRPTSESAWLDVKSLTITYECTPVAPGPVVDSYDINFVGFKDYDAVPLYGIDTTGLPTSADEGSSVSFDVTALAGYEYLGAFEFGYPETITDFVSSGNHVSFTMPSNDVTICLQAQETTPVLTSITLDTTNVTTGFTVGDTFSYAGLVVTAHYSNSTSATVTPTSVSSPDMSSAGEKTVTVSYTESDITRTSTYTVNVSEHSEPIPVALNGKYIYESRQGYGSKTYNNMYIEFKSQGTAIWHLERHSTASGHVGDVICEIYFVYQAKKLGNTISIDMDMDGSIEKHAGYFGYYFIWNDNGTWKEWNSENAWSGGSDDRPVFGKFTDGINLPPPSSNNSGSINTDTNKLTIDVYEKYWSSVISGYDYRDYATFTFNLQAL